MQYIAAASSATVAKSVPEGGAWPRGTARFSVTAKSERAASLGEAGHSWCRAESTPSAVDTAAAMLADEVRPFRFAMQSATTESDIALSSGGGGLSCPVQWIQQSQRLLVKLGPAGVVQQSAVTVADIAVFTDGAGAF